ncbi:MULTISPECIES: hypothetical protein [Komagataeibacter]|uniref:hypothetical protein n=1 Tax=Komagataeibacter TaxID=1434011 RepID=UPI000237E754|nr:MULTISPECIES: hypothetical protein [Komagataeibacter]GBR37096.1 hypothetical protein AA11826_1620 [Komagataeibacter oboediens DSM 11826]
MHISIGCLTGDGETAIMFGYGLRRDDRKPLRDGSGRLANIVYNMRRFLFLERISAAA